MFLSIKFVVNAMISHKLSCAPMLDWTDRHCRYFYRVMSKQLVLYTEMVTTGAILHGKGDYLSFNEQEHPVVLQLGGSDPLAMAQCAQIAEQQGYDEVNINVGCPSDRVQNGAFGACLMAEPDLVAECVSAMKARVSIPVTVKTRIGIDDQDSYDFLYQFVDKVSQAGCQHFIVHARKAWLKGLSPKQNREVPPLNYERVYQLKQDFPSLFISINGGITSLAQAQQLLTQVDGVMMGREIYNNPYIVADIDQQIYQLSSEKISREQVVTHMADYVNQHVANGGKAWHVYRHMLGLCNGLSGARKFRRLLSETAGNTNANGEQLLQAFAQVSLATPVS
jgi:tRNA-dihydrouridine synthase A